MKQTTAGLVQKQLCKALHKTFKQIKQNFPLKYFYGESANAIKIQIWVTLIANLLLMVMQRGLTRSWSFSGLATMVRINLMYYVSFYSLFNSPEKDWEMVWKALPNHHRNHLFLNKGDWKPQNNNWPLVINSQTMIPLR